MKRLASLKKYQMYQRDNNKRFADKERQSADGKSEKFGGGGGQKSNRRERRCYNCNDLRYLAKDYTRAKKESAGQETWDKDSEYSWKPKGPPLLFRVGRRSPHDTGERCMKQANPVWLQWISKE